jgi:CheY-like chemotaxis protein
MTKKVLVVDDQYPIRRMVRWSVEHAGFEMHEASNGEQGLALALTIRPSLMLLDVMMPGRFRRPGGLPPAQGPPRDGKHLDRHAVGQRWLLRTVKKANRWVPMPTLPNRSNLLN